MKVNKRRDKIVILIALLVIGFVVYRLLITSGGRQSSSVLPGPKTFSSGDSEPAKPLKETELDRAFTFNAQRQDGAGTEGIQFTIFEAELKDEIKVQGEPRKAGKDKAYLLLRLELNNETTNRLKFTSADHVRRISEENKKYAPDYHNGTVTLDPISVRNDLMSFLVDKETELFIFQVGELEGEKENVEVTFE